MPRFSMAVKILLLKIGELIPYTICLKLTVKSFM